MKWSWKRINEQFDNPRLVKQVHEYGCGVACAVMLLRDRGIVANQEFVATGLRQPSPPGELATRLNELSLGLHYWDGGALDLEPPVLAGHLRGIGRHGSWAAQVMPEGRTNGHWIVVDGVTEEALVMVRDPAGSSYDMTVEELSRLLWYMVVVFESEVSG